MSKVRTCPQCGAALPEKLLNGLCGRCIVRMALLPATDEPTASFPATTASAIGSVRPQVRFFGDYELIAEIACGGMGIVYQARQASLNRVVALKMLLHGALSSEDGLRRFRAEAEAAASLQHPNIVAIHEIGTHEGLHYFSMDYVEGASLDALVRSGPLPPEGAARYVRTIAEAIHYAHQRGILHRDLKPSNILIDSLDQPRVTDFGLAKRLTTESDLTITGQILGSVSYMSPEQATGKHEGVGVPSDIYSMGAILYHLLTGHPPFAAETIPETLLLLQTTEPTAPRVYHRAIPRDLETICLKCLAKQPPDRYGSADALAEDLRRWLAGEPILARSPSLTERAGRAIRRHPALASLGVMLALAPIGAAIVWPRTPPLRIPPHVTELIVITDNTATPPGVLIVDPAATFQHRLPPLVAGVDVSPDGRHLTFLRPESPTNTSVWISRLDGSRPERIVGAATEPRWLDDRTLLYQPLDRLSLRAVDIATKTSRKLFDWTALTPRGHSSEPALSPDGKRLLVNPQNGRMAHWADVFVCDLDGRNARVVWQDEEDFNNPDSGTSDHFLVWLDNERVAWCRHARPGNRVFDTAIVTCRVGDTKYQALTPWRGINYPLACSPDGKRILFMTEDHPGLGNLELWSMNTDGTDRRRMLEKKFGSDFSVSARWLKRPQ